MKSKTSLFNKAIFKRNLTGYFGFWSGLFVVYLLMLPFNIYMNLAGLRWDEANSDHKKRLLYAMAEALWGNMRLFVVIFAFAAVLAAMFVFSYLFTARNSNMMHTYPVCRTSLFVTNYLSGISFLVIPLILGALLALLVGIVNGTVNSDIVHIYFIWIGVSIVENIFFFSAAVCVIMFVGNIVAVPVLYLILNFLYWGSMMIMNGMVGIVGYGLSRFQVDVIDVLTPMEYMGRAIGFQAYYTDIDRWECHGEKALFGYFVVAIVFIFIAWIAYQKKDIETAGDVITVGWLKPIFRWGVAICVSSLGSLLISGMLMNRSFILILGSAVIFGVVSFFVAQMLLQRSVHVFTQKRMIECMVYTIILCAFHIALDADVLGLEKKLPDVDKVVGVSISGSVTCYAEDEETISWAHNIHKQIIDSKKEFETAVNHLNGEGIEYVDINYVLEDGSRMVRVYEIPYEATLAEQIREYTNQPEIILKQYFGVHYPDITIYGGVLEIFFTGEVSREVRIPETEAKKLYQAVIEDVQSGHMDIDESESFGRIVFNVRDEEGFRYHDVSFYQEELTKDGEAEFLIDTRFTCLIQKLQELGYLSESDYKRIGS